MRQALKDQEVGLDPHFRYRGKNQTRVETFSDAAFALAITLVVLSNSVPDTFADLWVSLRQIIPFGLCVVLVMVIWYQHYTFFLRYGLQNLRVITLNTFLIFLILIYVYPLKFLFKVLFELYTALILGDNQQVQYLFQEVIPFNDSRYLMIIYGIGAALIFTTLALMYRHALSKSTELDLDKYEIWETKVSVRTNLLLASLPVLSTIIALTGAFGNYNFLASGILYMLYPPLMITHGIITDKVSKKLLEELQV